MAFRRNHYFYDLPEVLQDKIMKMKSGSVFVKEQLIET
jgi:hypothetical protein